MLTSRINKLTIKYTRNKHHIMMVDNNECAFSTMQVLLCMNITKNKYNNLIYYCMSFDRDYMLQVRDVFLKLKKDFILIIL